MRKLLPLLVAVGFMACCVMAAPVHAQKEKDKKKAKGEYDPPDAFVPSEETLKQIVAKTAQLAAKIAELRKDKKTHELLPDVEIYLRGAENIVRFKEYYSKDSGKWTLDALDAGLERAEQLAKGKSPWTTLEKRNVLRAYRSIIDDTAQPYGVTYPLEYGKDPERHWRVDIVLHGRNSALTEVAFLNSHNGKKKVPADQDWVQVDIFGRGNNAYRWAGEWDVISAKAAFFLDENRFGRGALLHRRGDFLRGEPPLLPTGVVLRGFSMGGAGTWHLGLRHPTFWTVMGPGAGFTTTHDYAWKGKKDLPDYQEKCLRIYDAIDYAENARMIPIVAYSGGDDPQKLAADNIEKRLKELKIDAMTHLVKPGVGHKFEPDYFQKANALWSKYASKGRNEKPAQVSFVTYSTKSPLCDWISILAMETQYEKASVHAVAEGNNLLDIEYECRLTTKNVRWLSVTLATKYRIIEIDGQKFKNVDSEQYPIFAKKDGRWILTKSDEIVKEAEKGAIKRIFLQGPIDDAFAFPFVCVQGTGETWHPATQKFVDAKLKAFAYDWAKHWRGELPITNEYGITPNEIMEKHLILFGDPSSNFLLANILPKLPLKWTKDEIEFAGKKYKASEHVPVMIFPNPLNPQRYVVLNTGHTFPSEDYNKTNAMLYPRLGDYAILRMTPTAKNAAAYEVATAGLFDESWQVEKK
jgi:hypothetical protein